MIYEQVNNAINGVFFDGRNAGLAVYLTLDAETQVELAGVLGVDSSQVEPEICKCVARSMHPDGNPYELFVRDAVAWRKKGRVTPPPFSALLFVFSHAATLMAADGNFASNNYYYRLEQVTGVERKVLSDHRSSMQQLWQELNQWLVENNFMFGKPTARPMTSWTYVGWSISQAIVRASDRELFHDLFARFGFSGNESLSIRDMERYLANWMHTSVPSARLRNTWKKEELRERVAEAALAALAAWNKNSESAGSNGGEQRPIRLSLLVSISPRFPRNVLELYLGQIGDSTELGIVESEAGEFAIANDMFGGFATISPQPFGANNSKIGHAFKFRRPDGGRTLEWRPRLVIPLARQGSLWVEVPRITFGLPHVVLVRDMQDLPRHVEAYLLRAAMKTPTRVNPSTLSGLPSGWALYADVQVGKSDVHPTKHDLDCLIPVGEDGVLELSGGLQLLGNFYHALSMPTVSVIAPAGPTRIECFSLPNEIEAFACASSEGPEVQLPLKPNAELSSSGIKIQAHGASKLIDTREVYFRDASNPTPLNQDAKRLVAYDSIVSARSISDIAGPYVRGLVPIGEFPQQQILQAVQNTVALPTGEAEVFQEVLHQEPTSTDASHKSCIERGYHVYRFPAVQSNTPCGKPFHGTCMNCGDEIVVIYRRRPKTKEVARPARIPLTSTRVSPKEMGTLSVKHDILLDALSFIGSGSWGRFESLLQLDGEEPYLGRQVAQDLFSLGFIDLEMRSGTNSVRSWCVAPPTLAFVDERRAFLTGFRSPNLIASIRERYSKCGGNLREETFARRVSAIWLENLGTSAATEVLADVRDPHDRPLSIGADAAMGLAEASLMLDKLDAHLVPVSIGKPRNLQRFDPVSAKWSQVEDTLAQGAYRWNEGMQCYAFVDKEGKAKAGSYQIVKLLAARSSNKRLHTYAEATRTFTCTLGCDPPGLLARALVACSGELPVKMGGDLVYRETPPRVAAVVLTAMYREKL